MHAPLSIDDLRAALSLRRLGAHVQVFAEIDSTNTYLLDAAPHLPDGAIVAAEYQTGGRGRFGRTWAAPRGASILLSVLLRESANSPLGTWAGLLGAVAVCEAAERTHELPAELRWPNDVMVRGRKLAGILCESRPAIEGTGRAIVIGVGVNCLQHAGHFPPDLRTAATSLEIESRAPVSRREFARVLVERLDHWLSTLRSAEALTLADLRRAWLDRAADRGRPIELVEHGTRFQGTVIDLSEDGGIVLELRDGGRRAFEATTTTRAG